MLPGRAVRTAGVGRDREACRDGHPELRHLREADALAAEELASRLQTARRRRRRSAACPIFQDIPVGSPVHIPRRSTRGLKAFSRGPRVFLAGCGNATWRAAQAGAPAGRARQRRSLLPRAAGRHRPVGRAHAGRVFDVRSPSSARLVRRPALATDGRRAPRWGTRIVASEGWVVDGSYSRKLGTLVLDAQEPFVVVLEPLARPGGLVHPARRVRTGPVCCGTAIGRRPRRNLSRDAGRSRLRPSRRPARRTPSLRSPRAAAWSPSRPPALEAAAPSTLLPVAAVERGAFRQLGRLGEPASRAPVRSGQRACRSPTNVHAGGVAMGLARPSAGIPRRRGRRRRAGCDRDPRLADDQRRVRCPATACEHGLVPVEHSAAVDDDRRPRRYDPRRRYPTSRGWNRPGAQRHG